MHFLELRKKYRAINEARESLRANLIFLEPNVLFDIYCSHPSLPESHELSEEELIDLIQKIFIEMKECYSENSKGGRGREL